MCRRPRWRLHPISSCCFRTWPPSGLRLAAGRMPREPSPDSRLLVNPKGVFVLAVCLLWCWREWWQIAAGFVGVNAVAVAALASVGALHPYYEQVWAWGALYSRDTFVDQPLTEGIRRTLAWAGFHATIVLAAILYWRRDRRFLAWAALTLAGVIMGWRFFPRYYFLLLPAVVIAASRGFFLIQPRWRLAMASLLLIPLIRFGPRYANSRSIRISRGPIPP